MSKHPTDAEAADFRQRAEVALALKPSVLSPSEVDAYRLLHELQVHQVELEMQNDELHQAQSALQISLMELRIAAIAFESQVGMLVTDAKGIIIRVNRAFTMLTGFSAEDAVGQAPTLLRSGRHGPEFYVRMWAVLAEKSYWQGEVWNRRKDGSIYAEWLTISAVVAPDGVTTHYVGTFSDITQNKKAEAEIHRLAYYDPLTKLPNRILFLDRLHQTMTGSRRTGHHGALLFLDLDHFKILNDTRGHDAGDQLLIEAARRIQANVREGDTVARLGGDEFVVVLEGLSTTSAEAAIHVRQIGEKIREELAVPWAIAGAEFHLTASLGIAMFNGHDVTVDTLLKQADLAMYKAKSIGRNTLCFFDPAMQVALDRRSEIEAGLRHALLHQDLRLYFQGQFDSQGRLVGAEALVRWQHPVRGLVMPNDFIPLAEETGLILPVGNWVLETACATLAAWAAAPETCALQLAVNVSARQFRHPDFVANVLRILVDTGASARRLKIELTESMMLDDVEDTFEKMRALKAQGVSLSLDDFGTGHSSLSYLTRLPLDQLKIDRSFVRNLPEKRDDAVIAHTIISMAHSLGLEVIAEGVETAEQHAFLKLHHCHFYQGYLFSRPLPLDEFERLVRV